MHSTGRPAGKTCSGPAIAGWPGGFG